MQNNSFIAIHRISSFCCAHCLPGTTIEGTGRHLNIMNVRQEVGEKVIIREPTWTQVGHALVRSSLVFSRFNLKHKQRPTPSKKKACSHIKQAIGTKQKSTCTIHSNKVKMEYLE